MSYCGNCGSKLADGARFCNSCGAKIREAANVRNVVKCSNCGEINGAFEIKCSLCGYEFRNVEASSTLQELQRRLQAIDNESLKIGYQYKYINSNSVNKSEIAKRKKIELISTYPIPNTKEDVLEFMILASGNFDEHYYLSHLDEEDISDAWLAKIKQCYFKAEILFKNDEILCEVTKIYKDIMAKIGHL